MDLYIVLSNSCGECFNRYRIGIISLASHSFAGCLSLFSFLLLLFGQHIVHMSYMLLQGIMTTSAIVLIIFIMCYFGHTVTSDCEMVANSVYNELWYLFPIKLQKSIMFIILRSQHPYVFTAFKMYRCTLRSFTGVS